MTDIQKILDEINKEIEIINTKIAITKNVDLLNDLITQKNILVDEKNDFTNIINKYNNIKKSQINTKNKNTNSIKNDCGPIKRKTYYIYENEEESEEKYRNNDIIRDEEIQNKDMDENSDKKQPIKYNHKLKKEKKFTSNEYSNESEENGEMTIKLIKRKKHIKQYIKI